MAVSADECCDDAGEPDAVRTLDEDRIAAARAAPAADASAAGVGHMDEFDLRPQALSASGAIASPTSSA